METLNKIFTEAQAIEIAEKILLATKVKIKGDIADEFYKEVEGYLYKIYSDTKDRIEKELIAEITEEYVKDPTNYKFKDLRDKLWSEHKDDERIQSQFGIELDKRASYIESLERQLQEAKTETKDLITKVQCLIK